MSEDVGFASRGVMLTVASEARLEGPRVAVRIARLLGVRAAATVNDPTVGWDWSPRASIDNWGNLIASREFDWGSEGAGLAGRITAARRRWPVWRFRWSRS